MALHWVYLGKTKYEDRDSGLFDGIIWATMCADINYICAETAEEFCRRSNALRLFTVDIKVEDLEPYYGLRTNADFLTARQWAIKRFANRRATAYDSKWVRLVRKIAYSPENCAKEREIIEKQNTTKKED
jgi:hypothetical protein